MPLDISHAAQDFLSACLQRSPNTRPSVTHLLNHSWIQVGHRHSTVWAVFRAVMLHH